MRILLAEDEKDLNHIITQKLRSDGYSVDSYLDGREAMDILSYTDYDGIILDVMMPKADGYEVLRYLRAAGQATPVLFLTARDTVADRVKGLDSGANDYLVKPFSFDQLLARLRAMMRTSYGVVSNVLSVADLTLDCASHIVKQGGVEVSLSAKEFALLEYLMHNQGIVLSREKIENHIWNFDYEGGTNVVDFADAKVQRIAVDGVQYYVFDRKLTMEELEGLWLRGVVSERQGRAHMSDVMQVSLLLLPFCACVCHRRLFACWEDVEAYPGDFRICGQDWDGQ